MIVLIPSSDNGDPTKGPGSQGSASAAKAGGKLRVLIVEDEWFVAMEIETVLDQAGYEVVGVAVNGEQAVQMAGHHQPDLITMDIRLSDDLDGVDAALEINRLWGLRCLFVSAFADTRTRERAHAANPLGWLQKPFSEKQLLDAVKAATSALKP